MEDETVPHLLTSLQEEVGGGGTARKSTDDSHEEGGRIIHNMQTQLLKHE